MKKKRKKGGLLQVIALVFGGLTGVVILRGAAGMAPVGTMGYSAVWCLLFGAFWIIHFLQIIIHEAGHLVFGLLSGYEFVSFRAGSIMLAREGEKLRLYRYRMAGTGGQCVMSPPALQDGVMPFLMLNLGGVIMNLLSVLLAVPFLFLLPGWSMGYTLALCWILIGTMIVLTNGIPMHTGMISNDGQNALTLYRHPEAIASFRNHLLTARHLGRGAKLSDLPEEWFPIPEQAQMKISFFAADACNRCEYLMETGRLPEAHEQICRILALDSGMVGANRAEMLMNRVFCDMMLGENGGSYGRLTRPEFDRLLRLGRGCLAAQRAEYAYTVLVEKDEKKAEKLRRRFDKRTAKHPYQGAVAQERVYMDMIDRKGEEAVC